MAKLELTITETLTRLVNLAEHPLFQEQTELPAWQVLIDHAKELIEREHVNG